MPTFPLGPSIIVEGLVASYELIVTQAAYGTSKKTFVYNLKISGAGPVITLVVAQKDLSPVADYDLEYKLTAHEIDEEASMAFVSTALGRLKNWIGLHIEDEGTVVYNPRKGLLLNIVEDATTGGEQLI